MLVLSRKKDERFFIGDDIEVMVVAIGGGQVKLGIIAPASVRVARDDCKKLPRPIPGEWKETDQ